MVTRRFLPHRSQAYEARQQTEVVCSSECVWEFTERIGKDCVEALNGVDVIDGIHAVHTHFDNSPAVRVAWNLKPQMGPQTLDARNDEEIFNDLGAPLVHEHYDRGVFAEELRCIGGTLSPENTKDRAAT